MSTAHHSRVAGLTERAHYITDLQRPSNTMSRQQASTYGPESGEGGRGSGDGQYLQRAGQQSGERTRHSGENSHKATRFKVALTTETRERRGAGTSGALS